MKISNKVLDRPNLIRDPETSAILNTDNEALAGYKKRKKQQRLLNTLEQDHNAMKDEISELKSDISEIKTTLHSMISMLQREK